MFRSAVYPAGVCADLILLELVVSSFIVLIPLARARCELYGPFFLTRAGAV
jgi:hypothetical protein